MRHRERVGFAFQDGRDLDLREHGDARTRQRFFHQDGVDLAGDQQRTGGIPAVGQEETRVRDQFAAVVRVNGTGDDGAVGAREFLQALLALLVLRGRVQVFPGHDPGGAVDVFLREEQPLAAAPVDVHRGDGQVDRTGLHCGEEVVIRHHADVDRHVQRQGEPPNELDVEPGRFPAGVDEVHRCVGGLGAHDELAGRVRRQGQDGHFRVGRFDPPGVHLVVEPVGKIIAQEGVHGAQEIVLARCDGDRHVPVAVIVLHQHENIPGALCVVQRGAVERDGVDLSDLQGWKCLGDILEFAELRVGKLLLRLVVGGRVADASDGVHRVVEVGRHRHFPDGLFFFFPAAAQDGSRQDAEQNDRRTADDMEAAPGRRLLDVMFHGSSEFRSGPGSSFFGFGVPPKNKTPFSAGFQCTVEYFHNNLAPFPGFTNFIANKNAPFSTGFHFRRAIFRRAAAEKRKNGLIPGPTRAILS